VLDGKTIVDATNNVGQAVMNSLALLGEYVPKAHCYRAFNNLGWENFADPVFGGVPADLFYCGPAGEARDTVAALIAAVGLRPIYVGDLDQAPVVDNLTRLWFALALEQGYGRHLAFKLLQPE
jgi:predicted dinucleotide-binding enzyme